MPKSGGYKIRFFFSTGRKIINQNTGKQKWKQDGQMHIHYTGYWQYKEERHITACYKVPQFYDNVVLDSENAMFQG